MIAPVPVPRPLRLRGEKSLGFSRRWMAKCRVRLLCCGLSSPFEMRLVWLEVGANYRLSTYKVTNAMTCTPWGLGFAMRGSWTRVSNIALVALTSYSYCYCARAVCSLGLMLLQRRLVNCCLLYIRAIFVSDPVLWLLISSRSNACISTSRLHTPRDSNIEAAGSTRPAHTRRQYGPSHGHITLVACTAYPWLRSAYL